MSDCACLTGTPYYNKDGSCGCLPLDTGGIKPIPVMHQGWIRPPKDQTVRAPFAGECNIEAPSGFTYVYVKGRCVLHQIGLPLPVNLQETPRPTSVTEPILVDNATSDFITENKKLLGLGALAVVAYFIFGRTDKPKTREVTSISKY